MEKSTTEVSVVKIEENGDGIKMEKQNYSIDTLFKDLDESIGLNAFDTVIFAPREEEVVTTRGNKTTITVGERLKEKVREALPSTKPDFVKGLIEEAAAKYQSFSHKSERGWEKRVVIGYLTSIGAEELAKTTQTGYFEVPSGLDLVGIGAEGAAPDTACQTVRIKSDKFGSLCGSSSSHLLLEGKDAGYGLFENALDGTGVFAGSVGEYAGKRSKKTHVIVAGDAGSGFMAESDEGRGTVDGNIKGSSAGAGATRLALHVKGYGGDLLLAESNHAFAYVGGGAGSYAAYKAQKPFLAVKGKVGKLLGEEMTNGYIAVNELDTYQEAGKLLGHSGTGMIRVPDEKSRELLAKESKPGYTIEVDENFFADNGKS